MLRQAIQATWREMRGWPALFFLAWLLTMLSMPLAHWIWGDKALYASVTLSVLLQAGLSVILLACAQGIPRTALTVAVVAVLSWALEAVGSATGIPFGAYHYTDRLQPQIAHVPLLIMAAWMMMLPPAWAVGWRLGGQRPGLIFTVVSALAITAWDLFLDPQMTQWELWVWDQPGGYFGIPWVNFLGWFLGAALITVAAWPRDLPERPLLLVYAMTWVLETFGLAVFWGLRGPALCGFLGMGVFVVLAWLRPKGQQERGSSKNPRSL